MKSHFTIPQLPRLCNEILILSILSRGKRHGYELALELEEASEAYFKFNHGTLYPILHKLEKDGLIRGQWQQEGRQRKRRTYMITGKGKKFLAVQKEDWKQFFGKLFAILEENE